MNPMSGLSQFSSSSKGNIQEVKSPKEKLVRAEKAEIRKSKNKFDDKAKE